ncbi:PREDICTED: metabotropic glutamate receptor-like, partial [Rhagoletis zephyria]|uniref:metabotropic glutamate receptor-like n=1 Tax=Rhagoletis zephyria TaxID=28612 RepID=UPI000811A3A7
LNSTHCGPINKDRGIQRLEAMLFAIDKINNDSSLLGNIKLGAIILDTCSSDTYALNQSLEFIRASINTVEASAFECRDGGMPRSKYGWKHITGVVGGSYSEVSLQVANLLRLFKIPQVSYASTGTSLSDKSRYDFFARTVPPDTYQANALVDLVERFNWSYVSLVTSEGQYGDSGMTAFLREAKKRSICIAMNEKVPQNADAAYYNSILQNLRTKPNARGVVLFLRAEDNRGLLEAAMAQNYTRHFSFIASDGWGKQDKLVQGVEDAADGAITVELATNEIEEFNYHIGNLTEDHSRRNPWFKEFWRDTFGCRFVDDPIENLSIPICSSEERMTASNGYIQESKVQFVVDAVYSFAYALHHAWTDLCQPHQGYCNRLKELDGENFYKQYLLNVSFIDLAGSEMKFDKNGDGLGRYNIYNFQRNVEGNFVYQKVGEWFDQYLDLEQEKINFGFTEADTTTGHHLAQHHFENKFGDLVQLSVPESVCSKPCGVGEIKIVQAGDKCCWICTACKPYEFVANESQCLDCGEGRWPYPDKADCFDLELRYMKWDSTYALIAIGVSVFGMGLTVFVVAIFFRYSETPIVKASGRELSFILLSGICFCFLNTFILLAKPTLLSCSLQRFGVGFGFSIIYGALLTKTNRISRIFDSARKTARRPSFISPRSQVIITFIIMMLQALGTLIWFLLEVPGVRKYYPDGKRSEVILKCRVRDSSFLLSLSFNMMLITTCTLYAIKTRKIPENFNESKFIGFTMYTTCIIWLAFVPLYFGTGNSFEIQITTLCVSISLSAYVALFCLFFPKVYIILVHPDKNVRKLTMNSATYKKQPATSSSVPTTSSNHEHVKLGVSEGDNKVYAATATTTAINAGASTSAGTGPNLITATAIINVNVE